uniref:Uncharacterized protein n=2 Tax=Picea TaxID=3328 RepID=A0A101LZZ7_PICGL|nr:hypothetical protein ABT39_MTgene5375 [Picea glauca]QHR90236.1 hypothetical protein Q903MT_gene4259 [Picea sitchensis]
MLFLESHLLKYAWYRYYLLFRPSLADTIHPLELHSRNQPVFHLLLPTHLLD